MPERKGKEKFGDKIWVQDSKRPKVEMSSFDLLSGFVFCYLVAQGV